MAHLLNIHTATGTALVNLISDGAILGTCSNPETKQHAFFLHTAIKQLLAAHDIDIKKLDAIGATSGPGSYTGIRIGLATAKGLCYALKVPLITYNSLEVMALSAARFAKNSDALYCPMVDARRMEVYAAVYNYTQDEIIPPAAIILNENSFAEIPGSHKIYFSGSGSSKFQGIDNHANTVFLNMEITTQALAEIAFKKYAKKEFTNVPYAQPLYIK